jgi:MipA family protein
MKNIWSCFALLLWLGCAWPAQGAEVRVSLDNPPGTGAVVVLLFDSADAFADLRNPLQTLVWPEGGRVPARFEDLAPGTYALMVFHDVNGNGELDQNFMGIPREPLGFSNRYWAKGSPAFSGAAFAVAEGDSVPVAVELKEIFKRKGLIGVGAGVMSQSSPYRGSDSGQVLALPAITYIGERVQILGPGGQVGLATWHGVRLAATARYRLGAYDEEDSDYLEGMGDRKDSFFAGLALQSRLPAGVKISAGYEHDVLDRVGGGFGRLAVRRNWQVGKFSVGPNVGLNWLTTELAGHEYGVTAEEARAGRPEYRPGDAINVEVGLGVLAEVAGAWRVLVNGSVEFLAPELWASPLVEESQVFHFFGGVNYTF